MYIADLHIHSRYSRATSRDCTPEYLDLWARRKGIDLLGTGDFTHPAWRQELEDKLVPAEDGLYVLKEDLRLRDQAPEGGRRPRFVVSGEISSIYKKNGRVRKVHNVILLPGLEEAKKLAEKLETIGNIHSDGRPILGLDCRDLLEITLEICPRAIFVPAHIWTPHFSVFGAFSGFDTMEECFEELTPYIRAIETGLSSDPPMNWRLSALDRFQMISNSDAHSPAKLGREANLLEIDMSYDGLYGAIQEGKGLKGTIEFFPEEGKYHFDGHRKCHLCLSPREAENYQGKCPVCGKKLTLGVSHRIEQLADRQEGFHRAEARPFESLVPLPEVIAASTGHSAASMKVQKQYEEMLGNLGTEFDILRNVPVEEIHTKAGYLISEGIRRLREGKVRFFRNILDPSCQISYCKPWDVCGKQISQDNYEEIAETFRKMCRRSHPQTIIKAWMEEMGIEENPAMEKLMAMAVFHKTMAEFLDSIVFGRESDLRRCGGKTYTADFVTLMTLHGSKGLEFPVVLLYGARKGMIPLEYGKENTDFEEERRLFYVGMTRAKEELILSASGEESPFLEKLSEGEIIREKAVQKENDSYGGRQMSLFEFII